MSAESRIRCPSAGCHHRGRDLLTGKGIQRYLLHGATLLRNVPAAEGPLPR